MTREQVLKPAILVFTKKVLQNDSKDV